MPADISKLLNELRQSYPELADEPLLDQIDSAAYELAGSEPEAGESEPDPEAEPAEAEAPAGEEAAPADEAMPESEDSEPAFDLPPGMLKKRKSKGSPNGSQPPYA